VIALAALESVSGEIIIHNNRIEETMDHLGQWAEEEMNSKDFGELARAVMTANEQASIENIHANKELMDHLIDLARRAMDASDHFMPKDCNAVTYAKCMAKDENWKQDASGWSQQWFAKNMECVEAAHCFTIPSSKDQKWDVSDDFKDIQHDAGVVGHEYWYATANWQKNMEAACMAHQKQLENIHDHLEGEVEHLLVQGGCDDKCVTNMKDDGMLDDPSYVADECKCASNWINVVEP